MLGKETAMPSYNKVLLMGNLTRDVELKYTPGNQAVANLGIAVNRRFKSKEGELKDEVTFVDCEAWGYTAENLSKRLGLTRSRLYATALADYVAKHRGRKTTDRLNAVYADQPSSVDAPVRRAQRRSIEPDRW